MGLNGTIIIFPTAGKPPKDLDATAKRAIGVFEQLDLILPGTAATCKKPKPWLGRFTDQRKESKLSKSDYALSIVSPDRLRPAMSKLVRLVKDEFGEHGLPYVEFSVIRKPFPITCGYDGRTLTTTWASIEFSYEDTRYDPKFHRIRDPAHPVFAELEKLFSSPMSWDVDIG